MYTHDELFEEVRKYMLANHNLKILDADKINGGKGSYSEEEAKKLAKELVTDIELAFAAIQKWRFLESERIIPKERVTYTVKQDRDKGFRVHINFPAKYLFRASLIKLTKRGHHFTGERTGEGIQDIYALFTQGYHTSKKMPAGYWESRQRETQVDLLNYGIVKAPNDFPANSFISDIISRFEKDHPGITVEYPEEWH